MLFPLRETSNKTSGARLVSPNPVSSLQDFTVSVGMVITACDNERSQLQIDKIQVEQLSQAMQLNVYCLEMAWRAE